jgi:hypothetical protein
MQYKFRPIDKWDREKTKHPKSSAFKVSYGQTLNLLESELDKLNAKNIVIQVDLPESKIRNDGLPYSTANPVFQGVILAFDSKFGPLKYFTDTFNKWQNNLRAIALGLEALRKVDRYGITKRGEQYTGWKQLPAAGESFFSESTAANFISTHSGYSVSEITNDKGLLRKAYYKAALKLHPDKGGTQALFDTLNKAKKILE